MKTFFLVGITAVLFFSSIVPFTYSQEKPQVLSQKPEAQPEVAPDSATYVIGPEDILFIHVWKEETLSRTVTVRMDGKFSLPLVDDIEASGKTPLLLKEILTQKLAEFVDAPNVSVMVMEANSYKVYISGQVRTPGVVRLRSETTIAQLISMSGGLTEWANEKKIRILRKENGREKVITINYKKIAQGEDLSSNIILKAGDTVIVP